jgi:alpha-L-arabinofuranosidase
MNLHENFKKRVIGYLLLVAGVINGFGQSSLSVNVGSAKAPINNEIFGGLVERGLGSIEKGIFVGSNSSVANTMGIRDDIIEGFKECGFGAMQWPGGCAANGYDWYRGLNANDMNTDVFMEFCRLTECEPVITFRAQSAYASDNKDWVDYVNRDSKHPGRYCKYWQLGNEVWGCGGDYGSWSAYKPNYEATYNALRAVPENANLGLIAGTDGIWRYQDWLRQMLQDNVNQIEIIEIHDYIYFPDGSDKINHLNFTEAQYWDIMNRANESQMKSRLDGIISILDQYDPEGRIKIWEGEWGNWLDNTQDAWLQVGTLMDALSAGESLNLFIKYANRMMGAGLAQVVNVIHSIMNTQSLNGPLVKTPTFYVFKMYIPHHRDSAKSAQFTLISERVNNMPAVSAAASVNKNGFVNVSLTNIDLKANRTVNLTLTNTPANVTYDITKAQVVTGPKMNSYNDYNKDPLVAMKDLPASSYQKTGDLTFSVTLPPMSIAMVQIERDPSGIKFGEAATQKNVGKSFSILPEQGKIRITSTLDRQIPVTVSVYGVDGKNLISTEKFSAGNGSYLMKNRLGKGIYLAKITGENIELQQKVVVVH